MPTEPWDILDAEGQEVQMRLPPLSDELQADFDAWEKLGDEAWEMIVDWEKHG